MKFKEFKEKVEKLGYEIVEDRILISIKKNGDIVTQIGTTINMIVDTYYKGFTILEDEEKTKLLELAVEFAKTPIEEREDEEREEFENAIDSIINRLEVIQTNAEDVMNWTIEEIQERSWHLRNNLDDMIVDLEELKETNKRE